ncbi:hypothetical protein BC938DRAFT_475559 [Jimgerdemannia flammicorona]|uniref:Uncharacterized protein n=1 Tax=Jimgerdemannia flammicorona TaxID=994334 RepID=A0A433PSI2_9FUNG|nr:hypothetical protein BC938DRAFT_475559 [Jimgerdemannia flammicorona]
MASLLLPYLDFQPRSHDCPNLQPPLDNHPTRRTFNPAQSVTHKNTHPHRSLSLARLLHEDLEPFRSLYGSTMQL